MQDQKQQQHLELKPKNVCDSSWMGWMGSIRLVYDAKVHIDTKPLKTEC